MSYCVNCGVELDDSAVKCVLCDCPVVNPMIKAETESVKPFADKIVIPKSVRTRYVAFVVSVVLLIPNVICAITNLLLPQTGVWAAYVVLTSALCWIAFVLPFFFKRKHPYILLLIDTIFVSGYLYVIFAINRQDGWFFKLALPLVLALSLLILLLYLWCNKKRNPHLTAIIVLLEISAYSIFADFMIHRFYSLKTIVSVSLIITASCFVLIGFLIAAVKNKRFAAWLSRKFFV